MNRHNFELVKRDENALNVPQVRPIERYWTQCKKEFKNRKSLSKNLNGFKSRSEPHELKPEKLKALA
jgi:hypothetical protein